jgi:hypothetical protein
MIVVHRGRSHQLRVRLLYGREKSRMNVLSVATANQLSITNVITAPYPQCLNLAGPCEKGLRRRSTTHPWEGRCNR